MLIMLGRIVTLLLLGILGASALFPESVSVTDNGRMGLMITTGFVLSALYLGHFKTEIASVPLQQVWQLFATITITCALDLILRFGLLAGQLPIPLHLFTVYGGWLAYQRSEKNRDQEFKLWLALGASILLAAIFNYGNAPARI